MIMIMNNIFAYLMSFALGFSLFSLIRYLQTLNPRSYLLVWDGHIWLHGRCKVSGEGVRYRDATYPHAAVVPIQLRPNLRLYVGGIERLALMDHQALELARRSIALKDLFASGGQLLNMARLAGAIIPLVVAIWVLVTYSSVHRLLTDLLVSQALIQELLK